MGTGLGMRWLRSAAVLLLLALGAGLGPVPHGVMAAEYQPAEIVVRLRSANDLTPLASANGLDPEPLQQFDAQPIYRLRIVDGADPEERAEQLILDPRVVYAEPNLIGRPPESRQGGGWAVGERTAYAAQWAPTTIRLAEAQRLSTGAGITVAVLDTGIDRGHPAFAGRLVAGYDFVDGDSDPSEVGQVGVDLAYGHGTHVAGLVALTAPGARIMPLRVLDRQGAGSAFTLVAALAYAVDPDGNPATDDGATVINLSLSTLERSNLVRDVIKAVACAQPPRSPDDLPCVLPGGRGAVVVAAAGNSGSTRREYPGGDSLNGTLTVGASTASDRLTTFSNRGSWVDLLAPGEGLTSPVPGGQYGVWSGTSMATPLVAGTAALVRSAFPGLPTAKVAKRIADRAVEIDGPVDRRLDAAAALSGR